MQVIYDPATGRILRAVYDRDVFDNKSEDSIPTSALVIDEIPENKALAKDLAMHVGRVDAKGMEKYYMRNGALMERDPWTEYVEGF